MALMKTSDSGTTFPMVTEQPNPNAGPQDISVGGWTADQYKNFIQNDPGYMALQASLQGNEDAYKSSMRGALQKAYLASGYDVPGLSGYLDAGMADQAKNNPYSQANLSSQAHQQNMRAIQNALAARGGYDSGELSYGIGNEGQRYNVEGLKNRGALSDYFTQLQNQFSQMTASDRAQLATELGNATERQLALHPSSETTTAHWDGASGSYVDAQGNHYDAQGNVLGATRPTPPVVTPPSQPAFTPSVPSFNQTANDFGIQPLQGGQTIGGGFQYPGQFSYSPPPSSISHLLGLPN